MLAVGDGGGGDPVEMGQARHGLRLQALLPRPAGSGDEALALLALLLAGLRELHGQFRLESEFAGLVDLVDAAGFVSKQKCRGANRWL